MLISSYDLLTKSSRYSPFIDELEADAELRLQFLIADLPERLSLKGLVSHSGKHSCEICKAVALTGPIHWPHSHCAGFPERTRQEIMTAVR